MKPFLRESEVHFSSTFPALSFIYCAIDTDGAATHEKELASLATSAWEELKDGTIVILTLEERQRLNDIRKRRYLPFVVDNLLHHLCSPLDECGELLDERKLR